MSSLDRRTGNIRHADTESRSYALQQWLLQSLPTCNKIMLPDGGVLLDDDEYKALDEETIFRLPFRQTVFEYRTNEPVYMPPHEYIGTKKILFCVEYTKDDAGAELRYAKDDENPEFISVISVTYIPEIAVWAISPPITIHCKHGVTRENGEVGVYMAFDKRQTEEYKEEHTSAFRAIMSVFNAMQCSNVTLHKSRHKKHNKKIKMKHALPFDDYYTLVFNTHHKASKQTGKIDSRRHPREHLRRGHIRRCASGIKTWVNAAIIGAGNNGGTITKEYEIQ